MGLLMLFAQSAGSGTVYTAAISAAGIVVVVFLAVAAGGYRMLRDTKTDLGKQIAETKQEATAAEKRLNKRNDDSETRLSERIGEVKTDLSDRITAVETGLSTRIGETRESLSVQMRELNQQTSQNPQEGTFGNDKNLQKLANKLAGQLHGYDRIYAHTHTHYVYLTLRDETVELTEGGHLETRYIPPEPEDPDPETSPDD